MVPGGADCSFYQTPAEVPVVPAEINPGNAAGVHPAWNWAFPALQLLLEPARWAEERGAPPAILEMSQKLLPEAGREGIGGCDPWDSPWDLTALRGLLGSGNRENIFAIPEGLWLQGGWRGESHARNQLDLLFLRQVRGVSATSPCPCTSLPSEGAGE